MMTTNDSITTTLDNINEGRLERMVNELKGRFNMVKIRLNAEILERLKVNEINHIPLAPGSGMSKNEVIIMIK